VQYNGIPSGDGSLATFLNDLGNGVLTATWSGGMIWPIAVCGVTTGLAMVWALLQLRPRAVAALGREVAGAGLAPNPLGWWSRLSADRSYGAPRLTDALPPAQYAAVAPPAVAPFAAAGGYSSAPPDVAAVAPLAPEDDEEWLDDYDYEYDPERPQYVPTASLARRHIRIGRRRSTPSRADV
jgi:hypothetical protein